MGFPGQRIAVFDNDGTLWCEQPFQVQLFFLIDRIKELAAKDPTIKDRQPYTALLNQDFKTLLGFGKRALLELAFATHDRHGGGTFEPTLWSPNLRSLTASMTEKQSR